LLNIYDSKIIIEGARINKRQKVYKNLSQAVNFKWVSLHEILSDRDKQGIISEQRRRATSLTRPILDEKRMKQEREAQQSMTGLGTWLCYVEIILTSTVIENIFLPFFSSP
jgi:predicted metalloendopeptidase